MVCNNNNNNKIAMGRSSLLIVPSSHPLLIVGLGKTLTRRTSNICQIIADAQGIQCANPGAAAAQSMRANTGGREEELVRKREKRESKRGNPGAVEGLRSRLG